MERSQRERLTEELTLVLLYLTSFTEKQCPNVRMAWKTHDWTALDDLAAVSYTHLTLPTKLEV